MAEAYIIDAVRTPIGRKKGSLAAMHPADLGAHSLQALMERTGIDPGAVDDVVFGCVDTIGPQAGDIARTCWLVAGLPDHVPGTTVDRQCGSSQQAIHFAAQGVMSGTQDLVVAGGVQQMNAIPISQAMISGQALGFADPFSGSPGWVRRYGDAASVAVPFRRDDRGEVECHAGARWRSSHSRATAARSRRSTPGGSMPRSRRSAISGATRRRARGTSLEKMATLQPLEPGGRVTAGVASQIADASAALLIASEEAVRVHGLKPRARIVHLSVRADDPVWMLTAPIPATRHALAKLGMQARGHRSGRDQRGLRVGRASPGSASSAPTTRGSTSMAAQSRSAIRSARPVPG